MLNRLTLKNFKQHSDLTIDFEPGLNAIQGENGAGKSSILKGIMYALFGSTAAGNKTHLTKWGETSMEVELVAEFGTIIRGPNKAQAWVNGVLEASGQSPVTAWVTDKLGMDAKIFGSMLYAEQGKTQLLLEMGPAGLQRQLETVANIKIVDDILSMISGDMKIDEGRLAGIGEVPDIGDLRSQQAQAQQEFDQATIALASHNEAVEVLQSRVDILKKDYDSSIRTLLQASTLRSKLEASQAVLATLSDELAALRAEDKADVSDQMIEALQQEIFEEESRVKTLQSALLKYRQDVELWEQDRKQRAEVDKWRPLIELELELNAKAQAARDAFQMAQKDWRAASMQKTSAVCSSCKRPYDDKDMPKLEQAFADADAALAAAKAAMEAAEIAHTAVFAESGLSRSGADMVSTRMAMHDISDPIEEPLPIDIDQAQIDKIRSEVEAKRNKLASLRRDKLDYQTWRTAITRMEQRISDQQQDISSSEEKLEALAIPTDAQIAASKAALDQESNLLAEMLGNTPNVWMPTARLAELNNRLELAEQKVDEVNRINHGMALRSELQKFLRTNRAKLMDDSWSALTTYSSHLISLITDGLITDLRRSENGDFTVNEGGNLAPVEELSGARKSIVGLSLRLGLAHLFYGDSGFVLLDEVTADCTDTNSAKVAGMLKSLKSQVIMVTHRQGDAMNANNSIVLS